MRVASSAYHSKVSAERSMLAALAHQRGGALEDGGALEGAGPAPVREGRVGRRDGLVDVLGVS
jgi:hypothetical protein